MPSGSFNIERLTGRDNYSSWSFAVKSYLQHEELWGVVSGTVKVEGDAALKLDIKAKAKIVLLVDKIIYVHIMEAKTAKETWDRLKSTYEDSGLTRKVGLLRSLITTDLSSCAGTEDYVNKIITTAHKLSEIGFSVSEDWIGTLLLAGLPEKYAPMIMGIESSGIEISSDAIKTKLLQDVKVESHTVESQQAFHAVTIAIITKQ